jgi:dolichol-phosphate mannosyltransferase
MPLEPEATPQTPRLFSTAPAQDKLALVIPTLREADNLRTLLAKTQTALESTGVPYEILVVDDDSCDGTEELVNAVTDADPRVRLLVRKGERGLSGAILHGWQCTDASVLGVMDADLQHPPELIPLLIAALVKGNDLVIGSRYAVGGGIGEWNPIRKLISAAAVWVTYPLQRSSIRAHDPMSGFFFVRRRCVQNVMFQPTGFKLLLEILIRGHIRSVGEVPFEFGRRAAGSSKATLKVAWEYLRLLLRLYGHRVQRQPVITEEPAGD